MKTVSPPLPEALRLKVLWQYDVLDTVPEEMFNDLVELAGLICEAPIVLLSLVDEKRQWFKARLGLTATETARDISFCSHAILQPDLFIVPDARQDPRFAKNPLVLGEPHVRFYAGAPLITPDGYALGTLCVIDRVPRQLDENRRQALRLLARVVMTQLEMRRRSKEMTKAVRQRVRLREELDKLRAGKPPEDDTAFTKPILKPGARAARR